MRHYFRSRYPFRTICLSTLLALLIAGLVSCSPLRLVNGLTPNDAAEVATDYAYGTGARQRLDIYQPEQPVAGSPVVVFFYGGSWRRGDKDLYRFVGHSLSGRGYVTVIPNYRLYPEVSFPGFVEDGAQALSWITNNIEQSRNGVVVIGHSAGAHLAAFLALDKQYLQNAGVSRASLSGMIGLAGPYGFDPLKYRRTRPVFENVNNIEDAQPITFACSGGPPLLLLHGRDDTIVIPDNSRSMYERVKTCGGQVQYAELEDLGHFGILLGLSESFLDHTDILSRIDTFLQEQSAVN